MTEVVQQNGQGQSEGGENFEVYARERVGQGLFYEIHSGNEVVYTASHVEDLINEFKSRGIAMSQVHLPNGGEIISTKDGLLRNLVHDEIVTLLDNDPQHLTTRVREDPSGKVYYEAVQGEKIIASAASLEGLKNVLIASDIPLSTVEVPNGAKTIPNVTAAIKAGVTRTFTGEEIKAFKQTN